MSLPKKKNFESDIDGKPTSLYVLKNSKGITAAITNYGGRVVSLLVPDDKGVLTEVVVGLESLNQYESASQPYFGAIVGRYANRIANAKFLLDGKEYFLARNNGPNSLHGGVKGFQYKVWDVMQSGDQILELTYLSKDMEEGFPGNLDVKVTYTLTDNNELKIDYLATSDKKTAVNLTNHSFFNLNGEGSGPINEHRMIIYADYYTPVNTTLIPTGTVEPVAGTPFDFRKLRSISEGFDENNDQIKKGNGYDHNFVLNGKGDGLHPAATVMGDQTGIVMEVLTTEPGMQFYGGNFMKSDNRTRSGGKDVFRTAFCLETQHFPDSPNQPLFPTTKLEPGETFRSCTVYRFPGLTKKG
jgi:aldose 1-epimerase